MRHLVQERLEKTATAMHAVINSSVIGAREPACPRLNRCPTSTRFLFACRTRRIGGPRFAGLLLGLTVDVRLGTPARESLLSFGAAAVRLPIWVWISTPTVRD